MKQFITKISHLVFLTFGLLILELITTQAQQTNDYFFQKLTTFNGLSSNYIQCIFQDSRGFVWISTNYGLNRYDAKTIKVYHHDPDNPHSLPQEMVSQIAEDKNGILWINGDYGLIELNPLTEQFNYYKNDANDPKSLAGAYPVPFVDSKNNLWVATAKGLQLFDRKYQNFDPFLLSTPDSIKKDPDLAWTGSIAEDNEHNIWCSGIKGLVQV